MDAIPSPHEEPINPTLVVEVDSHNGAQGHTADEVGNHHRNTTTEGSQQTNDEATMCMKASTPKPPRDDGCNAKTTHNRICAAT